jgi:hypothetical protein
MDNCKKNNLHWGVSKVTPKEDDRHCFTNYQFLQVLNLEDADIVNICSPTINWIRGVMGGDVYKTMLFLSGKKLGDRNFNFSEMNNIAKAIMFKNDLIKDSHIRSKVYSLLRKKLKDACMGKLLIDGNFQTMIADPYAFCEYFFKMPIVGLLKRNQHYSSYWNKRGFSTVAAMRAPLTWRSEVNILHLQDSSEVNEWYKHINSGIIYNVHGADTMIAADSDYDFDIVMTTNSREFVEKAYGGLPITYIKKPTPKQKLDENMLYLSDLYAFNSEIGDSYVIVYSPVGKTGYNLFGKCN